MIFAEDQEGILWIGTNRDGIYSYDGETFTKCEMDQNARGADVINKLLIDTDGNVYAATKNGAFSVDSDQNTAQCCEGTQNMIFRDAEELGNGDKILMEKSGRIFVLGKENAELQELNLSGKTETPRCSSKGKDDIFYVGTTGSNILKVDSKGEVQENINADGLSSINGIYEFADGKYWICSDNGIGLMEHDKVRKLDLKLNDSVEDVCTDYQGNYWFVSSRQGVMQLYKNGISNLGEYWGISQTVNSIQKHDGKFYVGCENGLYCYEDKTSVENNLTKACKDERIRQLYEDSEGNLWIATYQGGIKVLTNTGEIITYHTENSGLGTDQIRCMTETEDGNILIGTEYGVYEENDGEITLLTEDELLNSVRILDVTEYNGKIYAATDGYGVYEIKDHKVEQIYTKEQGLASDVVLKAVPSERMKGIWFVSSEGICFMDQKKEMQSITGIEMADSMDLILTDDDRAFILAGNGLFAAKETELLKEDVYVVQIDKTGEIPIDFTANARNMIQDGKLYMCGIDGAASMELEETQERKIPRIYLGDINADGEKVEIEDNKIHLEANVQRLDLSVHVINYMHQNLYILYDLKRTGKTQAYQDEDPTHEVSGTSYTDIKGGTYLFQYQVFDDLSMDINPVVDLEFEIQKDYGLLEEPKTRSMFFFTVLGVVILVNMLFLSAREKTIKKRYSLRFRKEKEDELAKMAYTDVVTGVYNRNRFEQEKERINMKEMYAFFSVSINHMSYIKGQYGEFYFEDVLRKAAAVLKECTEEETEFYRVSENVFYFWFMKPVSLENYVLKLKEAFQSQQKEGEASLSFSVGAVYNNRVDKEKIEDLVDRCEKMRLFDKKHEEAKFVEGKLKML